MTMPADGIAAILGGTPAPLHLWVMNEAAGGFTTFADQVVSGNKPLSKGTGVTPAGWGNIAGTRNVGGPQTPAPLFDGTANGYAQASGATLGGLALGWGIILMMDSMTTAVDNKTLYCERGTSGNDVLRWSINGGRTFNLTVCDDTLSHSIAVSSPTSQNSITGGEGRYHQGGQMLGVSVDGSGKATFYFNGGPFGIGVPAASLNAAHVWTDAGLTTNIGFDPLNTVNAFPGTICWAAVFGAPFSGTQFKAWYDALTPVPTHGARWSQAVNGKRFPNSDFWTKPLDPAAPLDPNSAARISQWTSWMTTNAGYVTVSPYVPLFSLDATTRGGSSVRTNFQPSADQHAFMLTVPTPDTMLTGDPYPSNTGSDAMSWICEPSTGRQFDLYQGLSSGVAATPSVLTPPYIGTLTVVTTSGTLATGAYFYSIAAVNANGESYANGYGWDTKGTLTATGKITLPLTVELSGTPPPTAWKIYRRGPYPTAGPYGSTADYQLLTTTAGTPTSFTDDGSFTPTAVSPIFKATGTDTVPWGTIGTALTSDWGSIGGGGSWDYLKNGAFNPNWKPSGNTNNGASASSAPAGAGVITIEEALNGLIEHPVAMAFASQNNGVNIQSHRWPAPRHDGVYSGAGLPLMSGMRMRFPATFDPTTLTYSTWAPLATFQRALATAIRDYGIIHRDSTVGGGLIYCETAPQSGRNDWPYILGGYFSGSTTAAFSALAPIPWGSLQVLMAYRSPSRTDALGRRTNWLNVAGNPTPVPY